MTYGRTVVITLALVCAVCAFGQSPPTSMFLAAGGGYNEGMGMTASFGVPVTENNYVITSADVSAKLLPSGKRALFTTFRPGFQRVVAKADFGASGSMLLAVSGDIGVSSGGDSVTGNASTGGTVVYMLPKHPNLGFYASYRVIKGPEPVATGDAVRGVASFGVILKLLKN